MKRQFVIRVAVAVSLLGALLFGMTGAFTSYFTFLNRQNFQAQVKSEIKGRLKNFRFSKIEFSQIKWEEANREFELGGKMFDVASIEFKDDIYTIYCENDLVEDLLIGLLKSSGEKSKNKIPQLQLSEPETIIEVASLALPFSLTDSFYEMSCCSVLLETHSPPPRFS